MAGGKVHVRGGVAWVWWLHQGIGIRSMRKKARPGTSPPSLQEIRADRTAMREAFRHYAVIHKGAVTATERRKAIQAISVAARRLQTDPTSEIWMERLYDALECQIGWSMSEHGRHPITDLGLRVAIDHKMLAAGVTRLIPQIKKLDDHVCMGAEDLAAVKVLADINEWHQVEATSWRDPALVELIRVVGPIWSRVAGYSAGPSPVAGAKYEQQHRFAEWLDKAFYLIGLPQVPEGRVSDIVRHLEI
jgi:hypothetical protein